MIEFARIGECFRADGFAVIRSLLDAGQLAGLQQESDRLLRDLPQDAQADLHYDFEPNLLDGRRVVQRIKRPHEISPLIAQLARSAAVLDPVAALIGPNLRLHHSKINVKPPTVGSPLEWHQDWAFIPHSNEDLAIVAIAIDPCTDDNGPLLLLPGSHRQGLRNHHHGGLFCGAIDVAAESLDTSAAVPVIGPAGVTSIHHPLTVHGSGFNRTREPRRLLFLEYAAVDAWPLFYGVDWPEYESRIVRGTSSNEPRFATARVRMPQPRATAGMIYDLQQTFEKRFFQ